MGGGDVRVHVDGGLKREQDRGEQLLTDALLRQDVAYGWYATADETAWPCIPLACLTFSFNDVHK